MSSEMQIKGLQSGKDIMEVRVHAGFNLLTGKFCMKKLLMHILLK